MFTSDDLAAINESIASGELNVKINGREVTYRSIEALHRSRRTILRSLKRQAGIKTNPLAGMATDVNRRL
jgi:hypothetical protein